MVILKEKRNVVFATIVLLTGGELQTDNVRIEYDGRKQSVKSEEKMVKEQIADLPTGAKILINEEMATTLTYEYEMSKEDIKSLATCRVVEQNEITPVQENEEIL